MPTLNVAGWWDQEDFFGPLQIYAALEKHDPKDLNRLVVGPWNHGGWTHGDGDRLGAIPFDSATAKYFREEIQAPWFAYYLKDRGPVALPEALTFEAGSQPLATLGGVAAGRADAGPQPLLRGGRLALASTPRRRAAPARPRPSTRTLSDPAHPVPYRQRPIQTTYFPGGSKWPTWLVEDQRFVDDRADVLTYESAAADRGRDDRRRGRRAPLRLDHRAATPTGSSSSSTSTRSATRRTGTSRATSSWSPTRSSAGATGSPSRSPSRSLPAPSSTTPTASTRRATRFARVTASWCRCRAAGSRSSTATRRRSFRTSSRRRRADFRAATHRIYRSPEHPSHVAIPVLVKPPA